MDLEEARNVAIIVSASVATITFIFGFLQYRSRVSLDRADRFFKMRQRREENNVLNKIAKLLEVDDPGLAEVPWNEKLMILGFYEDVALLINSGQMRRHVAHYMFAYYAIRCWESEHFWDDVNRDSPYWVLFKEFVEDMKAIEGGFRFRKRRYKL